MNSLSSGMPSSRRFTSGEPAAALAGRQVVVHARVREIAQRMTERRELPVEHGDDARLRRMNDRVADAVVAVDDRGLVARRQVRGRARRSAAPCRRSLRSSTPCTAWTSDRAGARRSLRACRNRSRPTRAIVDGVQLRADARVVVVDAGALGRSQLRQRDAGDDATFDVIHHVERGADDGGVLAQQPRARHGHLGRRAARAGCGIRARRGAPRAGACPAASCAGRTSSSASRSGRSGSTGRPGTAAARRARRNRRAALAGSATAPARRSDAAAARRRARRPSGCPRLRGVLLRLVS